MNHVGRDDLEAGFDHLKRYLEEMVGYEVAQIMKEKNFQPVCPDCGTRLEPSKEPRDDTMEANQLLSAAVHRLQGITHSITIGEAYSLGVIACSNVKDAMTILNNPDEAEATIFPEILEAARADGTAHYSLEDGEQFLVTWIAPPDKEPPTEPSEWDEPCAECAHEMTPKECRNCKPPEWSHFAHEVELTNEEPPEKSRKGRQCPDCGHQTQRRLTRCPRCKAVMFDIVFEYPPEEPDKCPSCGTIVQDGYPHEPQGNGTCHVFPEAPKSCETCALSQAPTEAPRLLECDECEEAEALINWRPIPEGPREGE